MALQRTSPVRPDRPLVIEFGAVTAVLVGVYLWHRAMLVVADPLRAVLGPSPVTMPLSGVATAGLFVAGLVAFAIAYSTSREIDVGSSLPTRADVGPVGLAVSVPVVFVAVTKLAGVHTGVPYSTLAGAYYSANPPLLPILFLVALGVSVTVPSLVVTCQVLVQGSLERVVDGDAAIVLTTLVTGFAMTSDTGGLGAVPEPGKLVGTAAFVVVLAITLYAIERGARERLGRLAYAPVLLFVALVVVSALAGVESVAGGLFSVSQLAVLGVAAFVYDRSDSLLLPALAYLSAFLSQTVVVLVEAGVLPW